MSTEAAAQVLSGELCVTVDNRENRNGARRRRSDSILENENDFRSLGEQQKSMKPLFGLQSLLHSLSRTVSTVCWMFFSSILCFMMRLAAVNHFSFAMFSKMPAVELGHCSLVGCGNEG